MCFSKKNLFAKKQQRSHDGENNKDKKEEIRGGAVPVLSEMRYKLMMSSCCSKIKLKDHITKVGPLQV